MVTVDVGTHLVRGQTYTMSLLEGGFMGDVVGQGLDSATSALQFLPKVSGVSVSQSFFSIYTFDVTFTYSGDGSDTPANLFQEFADALGGFGYSWSYVATTTGTQGSGAGDKVTQTISDTVASITPSTSSLWAIAVIGALAIFFLSGGVTAVRRVVA